jgi:predicted O-methyltransferase YrrM
MSRLPRLAFLYPVALAHVVWTFTLGLFSSRSRLRVAQLANEALLPRTRLPSISAQELISGTPRVTLYEVAQQGGNTSLLEQVVLLRLAETHQPKALFEFGTFDGRSALNLIAHSPPDAHLYTLDLPAAEIDRTLLPLDKGELAFIDKPESGLRFLSTPYAARITRLSGDSASFDFSPYFGAIDMVFIDASHSYEYVRSDTLNAMKMMGPSGGVIVWHDYSPDWRGVMRALNEFYHSSGVFRGLRRVEGTTLVILRV